MDKQGDGWDLLLVAVTSLWVMTLFPQAIYLISVSLGLEASFIPAVFVALLFSMVLPAVDSFTGKRAWLFPFSFLLLGGLFFILSLASARPTAATPLPYALNYTAQADSSRGWLYAYGRSGDPWVDALLPDETRGSVPSLGLSNVYMAGAPWIDLPVPAWETESDVTVDGLRTLRGRMTGTQRLLFLAMDSAEVQSVRVAGVLLEDAVTEGVLFHCGPREGGVPIEIVLSPIDQFGFNLIGLDNGLPDALMAGYPPQPEHLMPSRTYTRVVKRVRLSPSP